MRGASAADERPDATTDGRPETMVDVKLFKTIGLHQLMLRPAGCGRYRTVLLAAVWLTLGLQLTRVVRLYRVASDSKLFAYVSMTILYAMVSLYKGYALATHADGLRNVLEAADFGFTACGRRNPAGLLQCRAALSMWLRGFAALSYGTTTIWTVQPWTTAIDDCQPWTAGWAIRHVVETVIYAVTMFCWTQYDCYLVTSCFVLKAQFGAMAFGYESLGRSQIRAVTRSQGDTEVGRTIQKDVDTDAMKSESCDELILHIKDNQKIVKKYDDLFNIIRPVVLVQMYLGSYSVVTIIFLTLLEFITSRSSIFKYFMGFVFIVMQLYIHCLALNHLEMAKSEVNFGLYSSSWTETNIRFKKSLLLTMQMNAAHKRTIKITPLCVVNMEMFAKVMKTSYSIASVLLNMSTKQKAE